MQAPARPERNPSPAPARGSSAFAALVSLIVHAAIVAAAALSLGAPQPTGEPNAIAVELVASTGETPAPTTEADLAPARRAGRDDANPAEATPSPPPDAATPVKAPDADAPTAAKSPVGTTQSAPPPDAATPAEAIDADAPTAAKVAEVANETPAPSAAPARDPATDEAPPAAAPPPQAAAARPESDFAAAAATPKLEPKSPAAPPATPRTTARLRPSSPATGARAASAPPPARGAAEIAAYRNALLAKIWGAARYPEAARERGATGVATVRFALDGGGAVTLADLAQSSGDRALDDAALAAVRRASPLPAPPTGAPRDYSAPIRFELR
jgi:protein TonB